MLDVIINKFKYFFLFSLLSVMFVLEAEAASSSYQKCKALGGLAKVTMETRQLGRDLDGHMKFYEGRPFERMVMKLSVRAWSVPIRDTEAEKSAEAEMFKMKVIMECAEDRF